MSIYNKVLQLIKATREKKLVPITVPVDTTKLLSGKIAFISGGSGGIGMAIAKALLDSGCKVILGGTNEERLLKCKSSIKSDYSENVEIYQFNIERIEEFKKDISNIADIFGRVDIYVNSAGVHTENLDFWNMPIKEYDRVLDINLKGPYFACIEMAKYMKDHNISGHMLIISSTRGFEPAWSPYGISKWGLNGMIEGLAQQFIRYGITINGIAPGPTATKLVGINEGDSIYSNETKANRLATPEEIASFACLLVSDAGCMTSGEVVRISAGRGVFDIR